MSIKELTDSIRRYSETELCKTLKIINNKAEGLERENENLKQSLRECLAQMGRNTEAATALRVENAELKKLVAQMKTFLQTAVEDWAGKFNHDENPEHGGWAVQAGNILNALEAAKGEKE